MTKIITITANTAVDYLVEVDSFVPGSVISARRSRLFPAGKGINVARTIEGLGKEVVAFGIIGSSSGRLFEQLSSQLFSTRFIEAPGESRTNVSIYDRGAGITTHLKAFGYHVQYEHLRTLSSLFATVVNAEDLVVISGSLPKGADSYFYRELIRVSRNCGASVILDSSGEALREGILEAPLLIKPNVEELEEVSGYSFDSREEDIITAAREIGRPGIRYVLVSRGAKGVLAVDLYKNSIWKADVQIGEQGTHGVSVGCGDALVGGVAVALSEKRNFEELLRLGVACGAANLFNEIPGLCDPRIVADLELKVKVEQIA